MSAKKLKTPRTMISDYLDASKTQMVSPHRKQARTVPRTPEAYSKGSGDQILPHDRVASLRKKRRSLSSADEEETPRQLIAQYLATADTTAPLLRHGRRTSQSGISASQPAIPVSNDKRQRRSFHLDDMSIDIESETPRTLINRYLQNASQTVETPVVRHQSPSPHESPEAGIVQDTYNTPSPFKESSQGSTGSIRRSTRELSSRKLGRSATKSNYSLVIPESQGMASSPSTDNLLQRREFHMPSAFGSSDSEGEEEEMPLPNISKFHRTRHTHAGYNLTVSESMLERLQQREEPFHESRAEQERQMVSDDAEDQGNEDDLQGDEYRMYELPMQPAEKSDEDIFAVPDSSIRVSDSLQNEMSNFSPRATSTQLWRTEMDMDMEDDQEIMRESSRRSNRMQYLSHDTGIISQTSPRRSTHGAQSISPQMARSPSHEFRGPSRQRAHSFTAAASDMSHSRSPRRSEPVYRTDRRMDSSPVVAGRAYHRGQHEQEHVHSITEKFSPRISSTQQTFHMEERMEDPSPSTARTSPLGTVTPSPVVSPARSNSSMTTRQSSGRRSISPRSDPDPDPGRHEYSFTPRSHTSVSRSGSRTPNRSAREIKSDRITRNRSVRDIESERGTPNSSARETPRRNYQDVEEEEQNEMNNSPVIPDMSGTNGKTSVHVTLRSHLETQNQSDSSTPISRSRLGTPVSTHRMPVQGSPRSPIVAGRMRQQANPDLVHTLPNTSANFSPQVASTQNIAAISRLAGEQEPENFDQDEQEPIEDEVDMENYDEIVNNYDEEEEDLEDMEVEGATAMPAEVEMPQKKAQKAPRKPRKKDPYTIPGRVVKKRFTHYAEMRVDKEAIKSVMDISEKYWDNVAIDLKAYATHAGRKRINTSDVVLLFKRQGLVNEKQSMNSLIERYLPMEEREKLIPCARAYNKIELNRKYIN